MTTKIKAVGWCLLVSVTLATCSKEGFEKPYSYVNLRVEDQEEDIQWDVTTGSWTSSSGTLEMDCQGIYYDQFRLHLKDILATGDVKNLTVENIYYTDGHDFRPKGIQSGYVRIMEMNGRSITGVYKIYFDNDNNNATSKMVSGDFGVVRN